MIVKSPIQPTLRDFLKLNDNNNIWIIIEDIIETKNLIDIQIIKVAAHTDNGIHNLLDREIKQQYNYIDALSPTDIVTTPNSYQLPILWRGHHIETNLRRFVRLLNRVQGLEIY